MTKFIFISVLTVISLSGCNLKNWEEESPFESSQIELSRSKVFSLTTKILFHEQIEREDNSYAFITYDPRFVKRNPSDLSIYVYPPDSISGSCLPKITGSWQMQERQQSGASVYFGKVDFFEKFESGQGWLDYPDPYPICAQAGNMLHRYAFCSQKNGKTVVICINQMTDNPAQAEEIISTFKWIR